MKCVIAAAVLLVLSIGFSLGASHKTQKTIDALYAMTEQLPTITEAYESEPEASRTLIDAIGDDWSDAVRYFSYVCGYTALNRADEAVWNLYASVGARDYAAVITARYQLLDALRRMRELEGLSFASVF